MEYQIVQAAASDVEQIKTLEIDAGLSPWTEKEYVLETKNAENLFLVARSEQRIIGFIISRLIMPDAITLNNNELEIYNIAVDRKFRRNSVASELLRRTIEIGAQKGVGKIFLEVRKSNESAQNFYLKHGFEVIGERRNFYANPSENAVLMRLSVASN